MNLIGRIKPGRHSMGLPCVLREEGRLENSNRLLNGDLEIKEWLIRRKNLAQHLLVLVLNTGAAFYRNFFNGVSNKINKKHLGWALYK